MDYTDLTTVKSYMSSVETGDDTLLSSLITAASRMIDQLATAQPNVSNYFMQEDVVNEILTNGVINNAGDLVVYPHKPIINSVVSLNYRYNLQQNWIAADMSAVMADQESVLCEAQLIYQERIYVQISYNGGLATTESGLPNNFRDLATLETVRLYKEAKSGLGDSIGVAELGTMIYTKAFPVRLMNSLNAGGYVCTVGW